MWSGFPVILDPISLYCARTGPGLLDEPLSLMAGLAFLPVALQIVRWSRDVPQLRLMAGLTFLLCPGAIWLHMMPSLLALAVNLLPVLLLILGYFYLVNRDMVRLGPTMALICTLLILPFAAVSLPLVGMVRGAVSSAAYVSVPVLLLGYAAVLRHDTPQAARGLFLAALIMGAALAARTADAPLCEDWPYGTHFLWILGVAVLLWHMARVYRDHWLTGRAGVEGTGASR
jgi:hypothetical protein